MSPVSDAEIHAASKFDIAEQLAEVHALNADGHLVASLLMGWAVLEALARFALVDQLAKPQTPGSVLERLAFEGYVSPSEADQIRTLVALRNKLAHGDLTIRLNQDLIDRFVAIIDLVHQRVQYPEPAHS